MVSSYFKPSFFISSVLLVFLCFVPFSFSAKTVKIEDLCPQTRNPSFCLSVLQPKSGADLISLGQYTVGIANAKASNTLKLAKSLAQHTSDPQLKKHYESCADQYDNVLDALDLAKTYLGTGDYLGVSVSGSAVLDDVDDCESDSSPSDPSSLPENNKDLEDLGSIILIIGNNLRQ